jgi:endonuclease/exonuclease/phosphatase family metal-dependent hydrolase
VENERPGRYAPTLRSKENAVTFSKLLCVLATAAALTVPAAQAGDSHPLAGSRQVTVMTRNLYLGTDLKPILSAQARSAMFTAVGDGWAQVQANDFKARADALADEIAAAKPDLVGLQEAMLYRTDVPPDGPATPAETVSLDFLELLRDALAGRGLAYEARSVFTGTDAELPAGLPPTEDVRLTDRVVVLARSDERMARLKLSNPQSGGYPTALTLTTAAGPVTLPRGWASVDVKTRGKTFRFITTHLEAFSPLVRNQQAAEILTGPASTDLPVVLVGDMNSGPGSDLSAYRTLLSDGFTDAWRDGTGLTCCHAVDLHDPDAALTKRIDLVLTKGWFRAVSTEVTGEEPDQRTPSGLWPSDHAGLVATLRLPTQETEVVHTTRTRIAPSALAPWFPVSPRQPRRRSPELTSGARCGTAVDSTSL